MPLASCSIIRAWTEYPVDVGIIELEKTVLSKMPLKVIDGDLERKGERQFCEECEFRDICKPGSLALEKR
jgi:hypothetical protein